MDYIEYERKNNISYVLLNRPTSYNALHKDMFTELLEVIHLIEKNNDAVVIISGKGKAFSAGGDMHLLKAFSDKAIFDEVMDTLEEIIIKLYTMPKIIISAVNGPVAGFGLSLALAADYVVADEQATFGVLFLGVGLIPDGGGHFFLRDRLGTHQAKQLTWDLSSFDSYKAKDIGLIDVVANQGEVISKGTEVGQQILTMPTKAMIQTKVIYHSSNTDSLRHYLTKERDAQWQLIQTEDHQEGVDAFLQKRSPKFKGK